MRKILLGYLLGVIISVGAYTYVTKDNPIKRAVSGKATPKFIAGQCAAYCPNGREIIKAKESWEQDRIPWCMTSIEILQVGEEKYLVNTHYSSNSPAPFRPNESEWISQADDMFELISCKEVNSILEDPNK